MTGGVTNLCVFEIVGFCGIIVLIDMVEIKSEKTLNNKNILTNKYINSYVILVDWNL